MDDVVEIKQEKNESPRESPAPEKDNCGRSATTKVVVMDSNTSTASISRSYYSSEMDLDLEEISRSSRKKRPKTTATGSGNLVILPVGFLDPLPPEERRTLSRKTSSTNAAVSVNTILHHPIPIASVDNCKQFWKAGDYEAFNAPDSATRTVGMDYLRVHSKFLHSNATSHKWALGAIAELLDNALDEVYNGATYVHIDMLPNKKDKSKMLLVEDNGGGMAPDIMRHCMSLGYSVKSKTANTIGQYGNGFKTSTMRLGADVIVFSRCRGKDGRSPTQSIGMLSYTFLRRTGKEDIVVPMIDYKKKGEYWNMMVRSSHDDWKRNLETILMWSPYASEEDLHQEFELLKDQGTRIIIYNLWEDDQGGLELDFKTDKHDIQISGANRDVRKMQMAQTYPNSRHFLTYRHSLRSYATILYLRIPSGFLIILRGRNVDHHNLVNDMMFKQELTYKPVTIPDMKTKDQHVVADVTIGFVKDAKFHIDVQGFNVYHKNRLIKPFWRIWNAAGSDGRGVIGVLEANFVEPAHDKQGFERTIVLSRLEARLVVMQKNYWSANCHQIGYAKRRHSKQSVSPEKEYSPSAKDKACLNRNLNRHDSGDGKSILKSNRNIDRGLPAKDTSEDEMRMASETLLKSSHHKLSTTSGVARGQIARRLYVEARHPYTSPDLSARAARINVDAYADSNAEMAKLKEENLQLRERLGKNDAVKEVNMLCDLQFERDRNNSTENKIRENRVSFQEIYNTTPREYQKALQRIEEMDKENESLICIFEGDREEESLRTRLKNASETIEGLVDKVKLLEKKPTISCKVEG